MKEFILGSRVSCIITGFEGIAVSKIVYINGCIQYGVKPKVTEPGKIPETVYLDVEQLRLIDLGVAGQVGEVNAANYAPGGDHKVIASSR